VTSKRFNIPDGTELAFFEIVLLDDMFLLFIPHEFLVPMP